MRHLASVLLIGAAVFAPLSPSDARGLLRHPFFRTITWFSLAVTDFGAATPELDETAAEMTRSIRDILAHSGPYPFKQSDRLDADPVEVDVPPQFSFWKTRGVGFLLVGRVSTAEDGRLEVAIRLWDTVTQRQIAGRRYLASTESKDRLAPTVAGEIFEELDQNYRLALSEVRDR